MLCTEEGAFELETPRDRKGSLVPALVKQHPSRYTGMDDKILSLYAKGNTTCDIVALFQEM